LAAPAVVAALALASSPRRDDAPLTGLRELANPSLPGAGEANLAVAPSGRFFLSWIDPEESGGHALKFAVLGAAAWSTPRTIATGRDWFVNWADFPSMLPVTDQELAAHWLVRRPGGSTYAYDVRISRSSDGGRSWGAPVTPHRDGEAAEHGFVSMWPLGRGTIGAVWLDGRKFPAAEAARRRGDTTAVPEMALRFTTIRPDGALGPEVELDGRICDCCQTDAALTADGPIVVYRDRSEREIRDTYAVRYLNGAWTAPAPVALDGWEFNACPVNGPAVAADGRRVATVWYTAAAGERRVRMAYSSDAGASFGPPVQVDDGRPIGRVDVIMLEGGAALVSWLEEVRQGAEVRVRRVEPSGERGPSMAIARSSAGRPSGFPRMARAGDRVVIAWRDPEDTRGIARVRTATARINGER
jgi:hypothetical protein